MCLSLGRVKIRAVLGAVGLYFMMKTNFDTLKSLASYTIGHLADAKLIEFGVDNRLELIDALATEYGVSFSTDDDIRQQAIDEVEDKVGGDHISGDITESEIYNHARKELVKTFNGETIAGLYLEETLNQVAHRVVKFLMNSNLVVDVFATDEDLINFLIPKIRNFSLKRG